MSNIQIIPKSEVFILKYVFIEINLNEVNIQILEGGSGDSTPWSLSYSLKKKKKGWTPQPPFAAT